MRVAENGCPLLSSSISDLLRGDHKKSEREQARFEKAMDHGWKHGRMDVG